MAEWELNVTQPCHQIVSRDRNHFSEIPVGAYWKLSELKTRCNENSLNWKLAAMKILCIKNSLQWKLSAFKLANCCQTFFLKHEFIRMWTIMRTTIFYMEESFTWKRLLHGGDESNNRHIKWQNLLHPRGISALR